MNGDNSGPKRPKAKKAKVPAFESSEDEDEPEEQNQFETTRDYEKLVNRQDFKDADTIVRMSADEFTMDYVRNTGLKNPIVFTGQMDVLDIQIPSFTYREVLDKIPQGLRIDMFNHSKEKQKAMAVKTIVEELEKPLGNSRSGPYNMLSLECSAMEMSKHINPPKLVRKLDWAQTVFPKEKFAHREYSKVEKYILMTMAGSYTEFHIDFGGTSVWYHVKSGEKHFFLVEPTDHNFRLFEEWLNAYRAGTVTGFFGDVVQKCAVVKMEPGQTLILPSGWMHAVYTPVDSLVYGGNFLHEYSISMQMKVRDYEARSQIRKKFTYPFYEQTLWYFAVDIVKQATDREYVRLIHSEEYENEKNKSPIQRLNYCFNVEVEPEDFYDKKLEDPNQFTFDSIDERQLNDPPATFNDDFLRSMRRFLRNDLYKVKTFLQREYDGRKQRRGKVAEGVRRPKHLLRDFERVIDRVMSLENVEVDLPTNYRNGIKNENPVKTEESIIKEEDIQIDPVQTDPIPIQIKEDSQENDLSSMQLDDLNYSEVCEVVAEEMPGPSEIPISNHEQKPQSIKVPEVVESKKASPPPLVKSSSEKLKRKRSYERPKSKPKLPTTTPKVPPKHRKQEEHLPLPSASTEPSVNDPVLTAVPLGKSSFTRTQYKKFNLNAPRKVESTSFRPTQPKPSPTFNRPISTRLPDTSTTVQNFDYIPSNNSSDFNNSDSYYQEDNFYSSKAVPCVSSNSPWQMRNEDHNQSISQPEPSYEPYSSRSFNDNHNGNHSSQNYPSEQIDAGPKKVASLAALNEILSAVQDIEDFDEFS